MSDERAGPLTEIRPVRVTRQSPSPPHGIVFLGSGFAAHSPLLKSVNGTCPLHGIAFITNGALGVYPSGSYDLKTGPVKSMTWVKSPERCAMPPFGGAPVGLR